MYKRQTLDKYSTYPFTQNFHLRNIKSSHTCSIVWSMMTETNIRPFCREDLNQPVTWQALNEVHIPLRYALEKVFSQVVRQILVFALAFIPFNFILAMTFRPFMHAIKPLIYDTAMRSNIYIAVVVVSLWSLSRFRYRASLKRLLFLLHIIPILLITLQMTFSWG